MLVSKYVFGFFLAAICLPVKSSKQWDMLHLQFWWYQVESKHSRLISQVLLLQALAWQSDSSHFDATQKFHTHQYRINYQERAVPSTYIQDQILGGDKKKVLVLMLIWNSQRSL